MKRTQFTAMLMSLTLVLPSMYGIPADAALSAPGKLYFPTASDAETCRTLTQGSSFLTISDGVSEELPTVSLPAKYDLREQGLTSSVKDQGSYNTCWTFSALGCLETDLIAQEPKIDLSEWHLAYYTYSNTFGYPYSANTPFDAGSFGSAQPIGMLTSWIGPVREAEAPYNDMSITDSILTMDEVREQDLLHVTDARFFPYGNEDASVFAAQRDAMKQAIYSGHALDFSYYQCDACFNEKTNAYCYYPVIADSYGHSAMIVGWDDDFPASNFNSDPGCNGAWLVKNSWGHTWGDNGYFWISYADPRIGDVYQYSADSADAHSKLYQHDQFGNSSSFSFDASGDLQVYVANEFTAEGEGWLTEVMFCNMNVDDTAEITVYTGLTDENNPLSGKPSGVTTVKLTQLGYQSIPLELPVPIQAGERFAVTAKLSGERSGYRIPCEFATTTTQTHADGTVDVFDSSFTPEMLARDFATCQSFYSNDGTIWYDMYNVTMNQNDYTDEATGETTHVDMREGNICLKAIVRDEGFISFSDYSPNIPAAQGIELKSEDNAQIYYSLDGVNFNLYEEPLHFPEGEDSMTISAYSDIAGKTLYTREYKKQHAELSSLLCKDKKFSDYADNFEEEPNSFHYYVNKGITNIQILPITTGTLMIGETECPSGHLTELPVRRGTTNFTLEVTQEGLEPTTYTLTVDTLFSANFLRGDTDLNGVINAADAADLLVYAAALGSGEAPEVPDDEWCDRADYNQDDLIDAIDASEILIYAAMQGAGVTEESAEN